MLLKVAFAAEVDGLMWDRWLVDYAQMDEKTFIGFGAYKQRLTGPQRVSERSTEDILAMVAKIRRDFEQEVVK